MANALRGAARSDWLATADGKLVCLLTLLQLAYDLELLEAKCTGSSASSN